MRFYVNLIEKKFQSIKIDAGNFALKVRSILEAIKKLPGSCSFEHQSAMLVVSIGQSESISRKHFEKFLLGQKIILQTFVVIRMVVGQIGESSPGECYAGYPPLVQCVRRNLHKNILTSPISHFREQFI